MKIKVLLTIVAICGFQSAHADGIEVSTLATAAYAFGPEAVNLISALKTLGVKTYTNSTYEFYSIVGGEITITNGAACDDGTQTYSVSLDIGGQDRKVIQKVELNNASECKPSAAKAFFALMQKFGGSQLAGDCGAGHCWITINNINCSHNSNPKSDAKYADMCSVAQNTGGFVEKQN